MEAIRLRNLRNLRDTDLIQIRPITFLLGSNSSGKSTFLRCFPLIKQSITTRTTGPILWFGDLVDFGSFSEALNNKSNSKEICFAYKFQIPKNSGRSMNAAQFRLLQLHPIIEDLDIVIEIKVTTEEKRQKNTICKEFSLSISGHTINIEIDSAKEVLVFDVNGRNILAEGLRLKADQSNGFIPQIYKPKDEREGEDDSFYPSMNERIRNLFLVDKLVELSRKLVHHKTSQSTVNWLVKGFGIGSSKSMLANLQNTTRGGKKWSKETEKWSENSDEFKSFRDLIIANSMFSILWYCNNYVSGFARNVSYIGPVRATAERYYRSQDLAVGEVDPQGKNLAMFLRNLTDPDRKDFANWTEKYLGFSVNISSSVGHVSLKIKEEILMTEINLADTGFGFSQILPILTQLWWLGRKSTKATVRSMYPVIFAIEQPELHLHPKLQALLADSFIATVKAAKEIGLDLRLIIETHSETLINRLGHRIANNDYPEEDVNVVLFDKSQSDNHISVRIASYDQEGFLNNWPLGFFEPEMI